MNKVILIGICLIALVGWWTPVNAQESATGSGTTENLKKRIEKLVEEKRDQIEGVLLEFGVRKRGFIGEVQRVSEDSITVKSKKGTEIISVEGVSLRKSGKEIQVNDIAIDDWVVVLGYIENDAFLARRILVSGTSLRPDPQIVEVGTITASDRTSFTLETRGTQEILTVKTNTNTEYQDIQGNEIARTDVTADTQALVVGFDREGDKVATIIRILTVVEDEPTDN